MPGDQSGAFVPLQNTATTSKHGEQPRRRRPRRPSFVTKKCRAWQREREKAAVSAALAPKNNGGGFGVHCQLEESLIDGISLGLVCSHDGGARTTRENIGQCRLLPSQIPLLLRRRRRRPRREFMAVSAVWRYGVAFVRVWLLPPQPWQCPIFLSLSPGRREAFVVSEPSIHRST